jgi:hypothetical protein
MKYKVIELPTRDSNKALCRKIAEFHLEEDATLFSHAADMGQRETRILKSGKYRQYYWLPRLDLGEKTIGEWYDFFSGGEK